MTRRSLLAYVAMPLLMLAAAAAYAHTANYEYDALGRLKRVRYSDGNMVVYGLDAAGNRTQVMSGALPGPPASISVPSSSANGAYSLSWGAASGIVTAYKLFEATNTGFSGQVLIYSGTGLSAAVSGRGNGTYYYRVQACFEEFCSGYRAGANGTSVVHPPGMPSSISVPPSSGPSYTISWGAASGINPSYQLYEATNASFSGEVLVYNGAGSSHAVSGKGYGYYYYRVRACNGSGCSDFRYGSNSLRVIIPIAPLSPAIYVSGTGQTTHITTLANLNGNAAAIHSFSTSCSKGWAQIESGAQSIRWTNDNWYYRQCEFGSNESCSASFVIRNTENGQLHYSSASIVIAAWGKSLPRGYSCP